MDIGVSVSDFVAEAAVRFRKPSRGGKQIQLSKTLTNPHLAEASLASLLNEEAGRINNSGACRLMIAGDEANALPLQKKNILFRMLQEFIQNSLKHSGCRLINIHISQSRNILAVTAKDDGKGFDLSHKSDGIGIMNMQQRSEALKAISYSLDSEAGKGTQLFIQIPLSDEI